MGMIRSLLVALVVVALIALPVFLHVTQKQHDRLDYDVTAAFPPDTPMVGVNRGTKLGGFPKGAKAPSLDFSGLETESALTAASAVCYE